MFFNDGNNVFTFGMPINANTKYLTTTQFGWGYDQQGKPGLYVINPEVYPRYLNSLTSSEKDQLLHLNKSIKPYSTTEDLMKYQSDTAAMVDNIKNASELSDWAKFTGAIGDVNKAIIAPAKDLMSTYTAWKGYEQARKEYDLNRNLINRNLANQTSMINRNIDASANIAAQQSGLYGNSAAIQQYNNQLRNDTLANANANKIKHNPL